MEDNRSRNAPSGHSHAKLRVLQVGKFYPPHMGGIETHLQALCGALRNHADVRVIVSSEDRNTVEETVDSVPVARLVHVADRLLHVHLACHGLTHSPFRAPSWYTSICPIPPPCWPIWPAAIAGRLVVTYHSDTVKQKVLGRMFEPLLHAALRRSAAIIATSPNYLATSPVLQAFRDRCHVIPYGIDTAQFEQCAPDAVRSVRERYGERLVISVGRLVYYKGFDVLIRAMASVRGKLVIVGRRAVARRTRESRRADWE